MSITPKDPLLTAGKIMTIILMAMTAVSALVLVAMVPVLLFNQAEFAAEIAKTGAGNTGAAMTAAIALLLIAAMVAAAAFYFFRLLARIIETVGANDPLTRENARRLARMGWIALAFQIASFPISALAIRLAEFVPAKELTVDFEFSLTGVLMAIILFILARVFKHGAAMREDLEGTV